MFLFSQISLRFIRHVVTDGTVVVVIISAIAGVTSLLAEGVELAQLSLDVGGVGCEGCYGGGAIGGVGVQAQLIHLARAINYHVRNVLDGCCTAAITSELV